MRLNEFSSPLNKNLVTVKVHGTSVKTLIHAESQSQALTFLSLAKLSPLDLKFRKVSVMLHEDYF